MAVGQYQPSNKKDNSTLDQKPCCLFSGCSFDLTWSGISRTKWQHDPAANIAGSQVAAVSPVSCNATCHWWSPHALACAKTITRSCLASLRHQDGQLSHCIHPYTQVGMITRKSTISWPCEACVQRLKACTTLSAQRIGPPGETSNGRSLRTKSEDLCEEFAAFGKALHLSCYDERFSVDSNFGDGPQMVIALKRIIPCTVGCQGSHWSSANQLKTTLVELLPEDESQFSTGNCQALGT